MFQAQGRQVGVMIPAGQRLKEEDTTAPDLTIRNLLPLEMFAMEYAEGSKWKGAMVIKAGNDFYMDMNGTEWLGRLRPLSSQLKANAEEAYRRAKGAVPADLPTKDDVDIIAAGMAEEAKG